jgi:hypothetical protein
VTQSLTDYQIQALLKHKETIGKFHAFLKATNTYPHEGQWKVILAFFKEKKTRLFVQCGRKWGKSFCGLYIAWRFALENPNSLTYIIAPTRVQAGQIYWQPKRLQTFGPSEFLDDSLKSEFTIYFKNSSQIILGGSDKAQALRGITPDLLIYDETRDIDEEFDNAMRPNLAAKNASILSFSTPPDKECHYTRMRDFWLKQVAKNEPAYFYIEAPTSSNPLIDKKFLEEEKQRLSETGRLAEYEREYEGKYIPGGASAVIPMWHKYKDKIIKPHHLMMKMIEGEKKKWDFYTFSDPAQSCFAVLFVAHNSYTSQLLILDEIYELDRMKTHASRIFPVIQEKCLSIYDRDDLWSHYYDPAESWFQVSVYDMFDVSLLAVKKRGAKSPERVSLIKDMITTPNTLFVSDRCKKFDWEISNWCYKEDGTLPDKDDHLIDNLFYVLEVTAFSVRPEVDKELFPLEDGEEFEKDTGTFEDFMKELVLKQDAFAFMDK